MKHAGYSQWIRILLHLAVLRPAIRILLGVHVVGWSHLRSLERFMMIANHNSHLDVFLLFSLLSREDLCNTHVVAERSYFARSKWLFHMVDFLFQPVWIRRGSSSRKEDALRACKSALEAGKNLILFPEGTRGRPGETLDFKSGIGRLSVQFPEIPILPVYLSGPERVLPKQHAIPLPFWNQIIVGPPQICTGRHQDMTRHLQSVLFGLSEVLHRRQRKRKSIQRLPSRTVAVLGIDGSGKSSLARSLSQHLSLSGRACLLSDRMEFFDQGENLPLQPSGIEMIRRMISQRAKKAASLKHYKLPKLTELLLRDRLVTEVERWYATSFIVQDGSPLLNMAAWSVLYHGDEVGDDMLSDAVAVLSGRRPATHTMRELFACFEEIKWLYQLGIHHLRLPEAVILLDLPAEVACDRIQRRGQPRQVHEKNEKLSRLRLAYQRVQRIIQERWQLPVLVLDATLPVEVVQEKARGFIHAHVLKKKETV